MMKPMPALGRMMSRQCASVCLNTKKMLGSLDVKNGPGGLIDIEFLAQALILADAADCLVIIAPRGLSASLEKLHAADLLSRGNYELLLETGSY